MRPPGPAYLDPATGTYVIQMLIAGVLAGFYALKGSGAALWARLTGTRPEEDDEPEEEPPPEEEPSEEA